MNATTAFARGPFQAGAVVILEEDEAHHLRVRRLQDGENLRLVDGKGGVATARLAFDRDVVAARVVAATLVPVPPLTEVFIGSGDRDRFLDFIEKAVELGATRVVPLITERQRAVATRFQAVHIEKAARRAREAIKQCGAAWVPALAQPVPIAEALRTAPKAVRLLADPTGGPVPPLSEGDAVVWAVGPEGGFTDAETAALRASGFVSVALGRSTLRFDTAALAALALTAQARISSERLSPKSTT